MQDAAVVRRCVNGKAIILKPHNSTVGAAEGCDLLLLKIKRSQPSAAPTLGSGYLPSFTRVQPRVMIRWVAIG
ncbi:hypothetical protein DEU51_106195 [Pseudomonas jessenii]|uniref:Uncharacterized protein n=1 Tax=Pseudomonas jessenii TaxID=77298 RepID=A0A370SLX0_PSEJE|nr:hypothetical protein DEU51_106195 [Pseudomonas jessenii]